MATCTTVATTAPSHSAPNNEKATVYRKATPNSYGPAWDSAAIIQPPATKHTSPTASAATYGTTGQQNRRLPVPPGIGFVAPHHRADRHADSGQQRQRCRARRVGAQRITGELGEALDDEVQDPPDEQRRNQVAGERGDTGKSEDVVHDAHQRERHADEQQVAPTE